MRKYFTGKLMSSVDDDLMEGGFERYREEASTEKEEPGSTLM